MTTQEIVKSKKFKIAAGVIGVILFGLVSFSAGVRVGLYKARFSYKFGENYEKNFMGPKRGIFGGPRDFMRGMEGRDFRNAHGIAGEIMSIADNNLTIKDRDNRENSVSVSENTLIKRGRDDIKINDLKTGDKIVVMGKPGDNGTINADLIRVFDNKTTEGQN